MTGVQTCALPISNCEEGVRLLLDKGADINARAEDGMTALMHAAGDGYVSLVALLLEKGADMEISTGDHQTAWMAAAMRNNIEVVELLRAHREKHPPVLTPEP